MPVLCLLCADGFCVRMAPACGCLGAGAFIWDGSGPTCATRVSASLRAGPPHASDRTGRSTRSPSARSAADRPRACRVDHRPGSGRSKTSRDVNGCRHDAAGREERPVLVALSTEPESGVEHDTVPRRDMTQQACLQVCCHFGHEVGGRHRRDPSFLGLRLERRTCPACALQALGVGCLAGTTRRAHHDDAKPVFLQPPDRNHAPR